MEMVGVTLCPECNARMIPLVPDDAWQVGDSWYRVGPGGGLYFCDLVEWQCPSCTKLWVLVEGELTEEVKNGC